MGYIHKHGPLVMMAAALLVASLACNLTSTDGEATTQAISSTATLTAVPIVPTLIIPSATPMITVTPVPTLAPTATPCWMRTDWPLYTVLPGDTLSALAARIGIDVNVLAGANCLADPNQIYVGQPLYVSSLPATAVPTATITALPTNTTLPAFLKALVVDRHWPGASGQWITYAPSVRVNAGDVLNTLRVKFFVNDHANGGVTMMIGEDDTPWDGAFIDYSFPHVGMFTFQAIAENEITSTPSTVYTIQYDPTFVPPEGQYNLLSITPNLGYDGTTYTLSANVTILISWSQAPAGALRIEFVWQAVGAPVDSLGTVIGTDWTPYDGAQAGWVVPAGAAGRLEALAYMPDGSQLASRPAAFRAQ